jgi:hypothetical protein
MDWSLDIGHLEVDFEEMRLLVLTSQGMVALRVLRYPALLRLFTR